jgi:hypothetical protein
MATQSDLKNTWGAAPSFLPFEHQVFRIMESEINPVP